VRRDIVASVADDAGISCNEIEEAILVFLCKVPGPQPSIAYAVGGSFRIIEIADHLRRTLKKEFTYLTRLHVLARLIDDACAGDKPWIRVSPRLANRILAPLSIGALDETERGLGHAVATHEREVEPLFEFSPSIERRDAVSNSHPVFSFFGSPLGIHELTDHGADEVELGDPVPDDI
jgi:hypothetical protein